MDNQKGVAPILIVILVAALVGGYLVYQKQYKPTSTAPQPTTQPSSKTSDETANWITYTNNFYGYSFKYPNSWETYGYGRTPQNDLEEINERFLRPSGQEAAEISLMVAKTSETTLDIQEKLIKEYSWENKKTEDIMIGGVNGVKVAGLQNGKNNSAVVFSNGNYIYKFQTLGDYSGTLDQILSTFKFLP